MNPQQNTFPQPNAISQAAAFLVSVLDEYAIAPGRVHKNCDSALLTIVEKAKKAEELEAKVIELETEIKSLKSNGTS